jgi:hypothetical protein
LSFFPRSLNEKGFAVKGKVHCYATPEGKQKYTNQKAVNPFPFVPLPSKDKSKTKIIRRYRLIGCEQAKASEYPRREFSKA